MAHRMSDRDVLRVLAKTAGYDGRRPDEAAAAAWLEALGDLDVEDCLEAVAIHHRESTEWLKPAHIRRIVKRIRAERLANADLALPPADPDAKDYAAALRAQITALADGRQVHLALSSGGQDPRLVSDPPPEYAAARAEHAPNQPAPATPPAPEPVSSTPWCGRCHDETRTRVRPTPDGVGLERVPCPVCGSPTSAQSERAS